MAGFWVRITEAARGIISGHRIEHQVTEYTEDTAEEIAERGKEIVLDRLGFVLRHPSGYYESKIDTRPIGEGRYEVHDTGVIYGPWLEGVGSRNSPDTFPGYHTFRLAHEQLDAEAGEIAEKVLFEYQSHGKLR